MTVNVRFPEDVHRDLIELAGEDDRSVNGEVVHIVRQFIAARRQKPTSRLLCAEQQADYSPRPPAPA